IETYLDEAEILWMLLRMVVAMALWSILGLGLGSILTNQVAAIVLLLVFTQFVEPILRMVASIWEWSAQIGRFLPGSASDALVGAGILNQMGSLGMPGSIEPLQWWGGGLVMLAFTAVLLTIGYF